MHRSGTDLASIWQRIGNDLGIPFTYKLKRPFTIYLFETMNIIVEELIYMKML